MKKILIIALLIFITSCEELNNRPGVKSIEESRFKLIERSDYGDIIMVDNHEYMTKYHGGIYHLESCPCKKDSI